MDAGSGEKRKPGDLEHFLDPSTRAEGCLPDPIVVQVVRNVPQA